MKHLLKPFMMTIALVLLVNPVLAGSINVLAAASLTESFKEIKTAFERKNPGDHVQCVFAGSPTLRTQIQQGAPADVFASADIPNMNTLAKAHLVGASQIFARNTMVIVVPAKSTRVSKIKDLAAKGVKLVLAGSKVPAGHYAEDILTKMTPSVALGYKDLVLANVVSRETDVKSVLAKVALGEADAGIVFATDAASAGEKVRAIAIPPAYNITAQYPIAVVASSSAPKVAASFTAFVMSPTGQAILRRHGFQSVSGAAHK